jgi:hypothetical protein
MVSIKGLSKAVVLQALFNASKQQGLGFLDTSGSVDMTLEDAEQIIKETFDLRDGTLYFDYLRGRVMKVDLTKDEFNPRHFDRDNGQGAALAAISTILGV